MNLFVERNIANRDVTLTLSTDNPGMKCNLRVDELSTAFNGKRLSIISTSGTPLFQIHDDNDDPDFIVQGTCLMLLIEGDKTCTHLFDESSFSDPIFETELSEEETTEMRKTISAWVLELVSI